MTITPPATPSPSKLNRIKVAKIDPYRRRCAVLIVKATMAEIYRLIGSRHVGRQLIANIDGIPVYVTCDNALAAGPIWRVKDGLPVRGTALLFADAGFGAADFPGDRFWLEDFIIFASAGEMAPEGVSTAINDPVDQAPAPSMPIRE